MPDYISPPNNPCPRQPRVGLLARQRRRRPGAKRPPAESRADPVLPALRPGIAHIFADIAKSGGSVVGCDAFLNMVDMSADAEPCPLLGRQRNWPRGSLWYGRHTMRR